MLPPLRCKVLPKICLIDYMARNFNYGQRLILSKSLLFPETSRQCLETGDINRIPAQSCAYNPFISVWFMMEN